jgi:hypothetical protein
MMNTNQNETHTLQLQFLELEFFVYNTLDHSNQINENY